MSPDEATRRVADHCAERGLVGYPPDALEAQEHPKGWDVGPRTDPGDLTELPLGGTRFLVTFDGAVHEGSASLPPRVRWSHVD